MEFSCRKMSNLKAIDGEFVQLRVQYTMFTIGRNKVRVKIMLFGEIDGGHASFVCPGLFAKKPPLIHKEVNW